MTLHSPHFWFVCIILLVQPLLTNAEDRKAIWRGWIQKEVSKIETDCLSKYKDLATWEKDKAERRRQLQEMLGLWPLPEKTPLQVTNTGMIDQPKYTVEKIHFQSMPGLYVTANIYIPKPAPKNAPAVLYVCGHGNVVQNKISYGSKVYYQHHPIWLAEHGYVAMVIDTLQLSEIPGDHHGTYRLNQWWWQARGYTPAGVECWNGIRSLDYLCSRPEVDPNRVGLTGRSGGGAYSWWIAALDERPKAIIPVAGIADLRAHLLEGYAGPLHQGVIQGHCDCMFMVNQYRWDFAEVAALIAPRPVLLGNSDNDNIFPVAGYQRLAAKVKKIYQLYGMADQFQLLETKGTHEDTVELRKGAFAWLNRWLQHDSGDLEVPEKSAPLSPQSLKVFDRLPADERNTTIQKKFVPQRIWDPNKLPDKATWQKNQSVYLQELQTHVIRHQEEDLIPTKVSLLSEQKTKNLSITKYQIITKDSFALPITICKPTNATKSDKTVLILEDYVPNFPIDPQATHMFFEPRTFDWPNITEAEKIHYRRRLALLGTTIETLQVQDVRTVIQMIAQTKEASYSKSFSIIAEGDLATIALYAAVFQKEIASLKLKDLSPSHMQGPVFLNVLKYVDIQPVIGMLAMQNKKVELEIATAQIAEFDWLERMEKSSYFPSRTLSLKVVKKQ